MTMRRESWLDDEERKLADQLARIAPHGEPSADLDARILAMAERGLAGVSPVATRRRPQRWPVWMGAAASLTVVAGLVWQLQPVLYPRDTIRYEAPASVAADNDPNGKRQPIAYVESAAADAAMPPPPPPETPASPKAAVAAQASAPAPVKAVAPPPAAPPPPAPAPPAPPARAQADAAVQADAAAAKSAAADRAMAQEAPRRPAPVTVEATPASTEAGSVRMRQQAASSATQASESAANQGNAAQEERAGFDARPPMTADTPEVQRAWLSRIRELRDSGEVEDARSSLAAFVKRNPKSEIPADLKLLLPTSTSPSTEP